MPCIEYKLSELQYMTKSKTIKIFGHRKYENLEELDISSWFCWLQGNNYKALLKNSHYIQALCYTHSYGQTK